jgi:mono/diheme cytochrome c family protein
MELSIRADRLAGISHLTPAMTFRLLFFLSLASPVLAQDGQQLFTLYCSACHGADGKGATGGTFPPLAESPWLAGDPDRATKIILKGLEGPVDVLGKTYNLAMPPQGAVLPDDQLAAVLTYVRSAWGNSSGPVNADQVKKIRASVEDRKTSWTSEEILKLHPLPLEKTALSGLTSQVYKGTWDYLPDFKTLKAEGIEEEHDGIISTADAALASDFGMVWVANLEVPAAGDYFFYLDADDAGRIILDDEVILEVHGIGPMDGSRCQKSINKLTQGSHRIHVEYIQNQGQQGITIGWRPSSSKNWNWLTDQSPKQAKARETIMIEPDKGRPVIYRNFIKGTSSRAIGVGFPGGLNLAYSADDLAPELIWTGEFIDGAHKWVDRGTEDNPPAGENVVTLSTARLLPKEARFRGYKLDPTGNPTFSIQIGEQFLLDSWHAENESLIRVLTLTGGKNRLAFPIPPVPDGSKLQMTTEHFVLEAGGNGVEMLPKLDPGKPATITYHWKK